jgi:hypothetical protein
MAAGTAQIAYKNRRDDPAPAFEILSPSYIEWDQEEPWGQKPFWDRVLGVATITLVSAGGWTAIIFAIRLFW